jgi:DNA-directed RNA polymerase I, II, and III subunit RPABC1
MTIIYRMARGCDLTPRKKAKISTLLNHSKHSQREIAEIIGVSQSTVRNIKKKLDDNESVETSRLGNCGRKRITTPRTERKIRQVALENRRKPRKALKSLLELDGVSISDRTLRRRFAEMGLACRRPVKKPKLTPAMRQKRMEWALKYRHWTVEDWNKV